jgi:phosphoribosyl-AMP cyclohydrolase
VEILGKEYAKNEAINTMVKAKKIWYVSNKQLTKHSGYHTVEKK